MHPYSSIDTTAAWKKLRFIFFKYPAKTITDADYTDDIAILANTPSQAETLLHSLERAAAGIGVHVNAHKTEYMCYDQTGDISTLEGTSLKLVDKFTYLGSSVSSTEKKKSKKKRRVSLENMRTVLHPRGNLALVCVQEQKLVTTQRPYGKIHIGNLTVCAHSKR